MGKQNVAKYYFNVHLQPPPTTIEHTHNDQNLIDKYKLPQNISEDNSEDDSQNDGLQLLLGNGYKNKASSIHKVQKPGVHKTQETSVPTMVVQNQRQLNTKPSNVRHKIRKTR